MTTKLSHLDQVKILYEQILQYMREICRFEIAAIVGSGAIYAWLVLHRSIVPRAAWFIAPIIIVLCGLKCMEISIRIRIIAEYLRRIEVDAFGKDEKQDLLGYERYNYNRRSYDHTVLSVWGGLWAFLFLSSLLASWYFSLP